MSDILEGRCLCGAVKIRVKGGHDPRAGACHCRMCQRWTGGVFLCFEAAAEAVETAVEELNAVQAAAAAAAEGCADEVMEARTKLKRMTRRASLSRSATSACSSRPIS